MGKINDVKGKLNVKIFIVSPCSYNLVSYFLKFSFGSCFYVKLHILGRINVRSARSLRRMGKLKKSVLSRCQVYTLLSQKFISLKMLLGTIFFSVIRSSVVNGFGSFL